MHHPLVSRPDALTLTITLGVAIACVASAQTAAAGDTASHAAPAHHAAAAATAANVPPAEAAFLAENDAAMAKMMRDMTVKPTGDIDRDFVAMMVPHHQGAIDMARAVLRYGKNESIRRLAQEIVIEQSQEITAMHRAVDPSHGVKP
jgi:uncharacterized protein (DUF305 family)